MELVAALVVGVVSGCALYLMMSRVLLRVILGTALLGYGVNLLLLISGGVKRGNPPLLDLAGPYTDPLPQALILTAIVISMGVTAFLLALGYRAYQESRSDDLHELRGIEDE